MGAATIFKNSWNFAANLHSSRHGRDTNSDEKNDFEFTRCILKIARTELSGLGGRDSPPPSLRPPRPEPERKGRV